MPSFEHQALVEMFRSEPEMAPLLLEQALHQPVPAHTSAEVVEAALDQISPIEYRADLVIEVKKDGKRVLSIIVEAQLDIDEAKLSTWPVYETVERARKRCGACVLVITLDEKVAAWASRPIALGLPGDVITPRVLRLREVPVVTDLAEALRMPALAVLSAVAHGDEPVGEQVLTAMVGGLQAFDPQTAEMYLNLVHRLLGGHAQQILEAIMQKINLGDVPEMPYLAKMKERERLAAKREMLLAQAAEVGLVLGDADKERILECTDPAVLDRWGRNVVRAKTAEDLFR